MPISKRIKIISVVIVLIAIIAGAYFGVQYLYFTPHTEAIQTIKMGGALSLTGSFSGMSSEMFRMQKMWIDHVNSEGGLYVAAYGKKVPIEFIYYDDQSDTQRSLTLARKLIYEDKVDVLLSGWSGAIANALQPLCEEAKKPIIVMSGTSDLFNAGYHYLFGPGDWEGDYSIRPLSLFPFMKNLSDIKTVAMLSADSAYGIPMRKGVRVLCGRYGFNLTFDESYPLTTENFMPLLVQIKDLKPDCIITMSHDPDALLIARQVREVGYNPKIYFAGGVNVMSFWTALGNLSNGITAYILGGPTGPWPNDAEIYNEYKLVYGQPPGPNNAYLAYSSMEFWGAVLGRAPSLDGETLCNLMHGQVEANTVIGPMKYDEKGWNIYFSNSTLLGQYIGSPSQGGREEIIWPFKLASADYLYPKPPWP